MSSASGATTPRSAACTTSLVLSRLRLRSSAMPGVNMFFTAAPMKSGMWRTPQMLIAVTPPSGSRCLPITGSDVDATLMASR